MKKKIILIFIILTIILLAGIATYKMPKIKMNNKTNQINNEKIVKEPERKIFYSYNINDKVIIIDYHNDLKEPLNLVRDNNELSIIKIKVKNIGDAEFQKNAVNDLPVTPIEIQLEETLYSKNQLTLQDKIYMQGGDIKVSEYEKANKNIIDTSKLTKEEKEEQYIRFNSDYSYNLEKYKEYIVVIGENEPNKYYIYGNGLGIFTEDNGNLKNVITKKEVKRDELVNLEKESTGLHKIYKEVDIKLNMGNENEKDILKYYKDVGGISLIKARIIGTGESRFFEKQEHLQDIYAPYNQLKIDYIKTLYSKEQVNLKNSSIYIRGGDVLIPIVEKYVKEKTKEFGNPDLDSIMGTKNIKLTKEEKEKQYIKFRPDYIQNLDFGKEYIFAITHIDEPDTYILTKMENQIFEEDNSYSGQIILKEKENGSQVNEQELINLLKKNDSNN